MFVCGCAPSSRPPEKHIPDYTQPEDQSWFIYSAGEHPIGDIDFAQVLKEHPDAATWAIQDPRWPEGDGRTALMTAALAGMTANVDLLLDNGADVNARDAQGRTALALCASSSWPSWRDMAAHLIDKGADVSRADKDGNTPLMIAVRDGSRPMAELFLQRHADVNARNTAGQTALDIVNARYDLQPAVTGSILFNGVAVDRPLTDLLKKWGATENAAPGAAAPAPKAR